jgi:hypothetical protein
MRRNSFLLIVLVALAGLLANPSRAQSASAAAPVQISGVVQSFSGNTLDVKPAATPAVWVTVPSGLHVDRSALKAGAEVSVEAYWADVCYIATQVTTRK